MEINSISQGSIFFLILIFFCYKIHFYMSMKIEMINKNILNFPVFIKISFIDLLLKFKANKKYLKYQLELKIEL